ncbi:MAG: hypothetical protein GXP10_05650 [Gammaproteobacteria bacterium]|nr:hypothetical protein [Gammaproteobacteria bacterium]
MQDLKYFLVFTSLAVLVILFLTGTFTLELSNTWVMIIAVLSVIVLPVVFVIRAVKRKG